MAPQSSISCRPGACLLSGARVICSAGGVLPACSVTANRVASSGKIIAGLIDIAQDPLVTGSGGDSSLFLFMTSMARAMT
jgi:hypothetical protein